MAAWILLTRCVPFRINGNVYIECGTTDSPLPVSEFVKLSATDELNRDRDSAPKHLLAARPAYRIAGPSCVCEPRREGRQVPCASQSRHGRFETRRRLAKCRGQARNRKP